MSLLSPTLVANVFIEGLEATQAIQYFNLTGQGSGFAPDNSVPLVANKPLIVRVYIARRFDPWLPASPLVTGSLGYSNAALCQPIADQITGLEERRDELQDELASAPTSLKAALIHLISQLERRLEEAELELEACLNPAPLSPINGPIQLRSRSAVDRGNADHTLNFLVPAEVCVESVLFRLKIFRPEANVARSLVTRTFSLRFERVPRPTLHGVLIRYTGLGRITEPPSEGEFLDTASGAARLYPIDAFEYSGFTVVDFSGDLTDQDGGGCGRGWNDLLILLGRMREMSGITDFTTVYVGLFPIEVPAFPIGCGGVGAAAGAAGDTITFAHELGHSLGRSHAPCGNPSYPDPDYPRYNNYPMGSIGEYGFDPVSRQVYSPAATFDFMSYCIPWVSPYTYTSLRDTLVMYSSARRSRFTTPAMSRENLYLAARMHADGRVDLLPTFHLDGPIGVGDYTAVSGVSCRLLLIDGSILHTRQCRWRNAYQDENGPYIDIQETLPWKEDINAIQFLRGNELRATIQVEPASPSVRHIRAMPVDRSDIRFRLEWEVVAERAVRQVIRFSRDGGTTWTVVALLGDGRDFMVDIGGLPGGTHCLFQVAASTGVRTGTAESEVFPVQRRRRVVRVLSPKPATDVVQDAPLFLRSTAWSPDFGMPGAEEIIWRVNDNVIGAGYWLTPSQLPVGENRISVVAPDGIGGEARSDVIIRVRPGKARA